MAHVCLKAREAIIPFFFVFFILSSLSLVSPPIQFATRSHGATEREKEKQGHLFDIKNGGCCTFPYCFTAPLSILCKQGMQLTSFLERPRTAVHSSSCTLSFLSLRLENAATFPWQPIGKGLSCNKIILVTSVSHFLTVCEQELKAANLFFSHLSVKYLISMYLIVAPSSGKGHTKKS